MAPLNYAESYLRGLEQAFPYVLYFGRLYTTPNNGRFKWVNSKTIEIPSISTTGRTNADRDSIGTAQRNYNNAWETKTLVNERKWSTLVHPKDIDQTNMAATITNITKVFNEEHKFPEMDAYTISKIYNDWSTTIAPSTGHDGYIGKVADTTVLTTENILQVFDDMMLRMTNARAPISGRVLYCTNEVKKMLKSAAGLTRNWDVQASADGINREVAYLDGVEIIPVPSELMRTAYDFSDVNGWAPLPTAAQINMCLILPTAVITPVSYTFAKLDDPSALSEGKFYYYEESFEDVFILNKKADAIQFNIDVRATGLTVKSVAGTTSGKTKVTVEPITSGNGYYTLVGADVEIPAIGTDISTVTSATAWNTTDELSATAGDTVIVLETVTVGEGASAVNLVVKAGSTTAVVA